MVYAGPDMHSMSVHLLQPCSKRDERANTRVKTAPHTTLGWSSVRLHHGEIIGNYG